MQQEVAGAAGAAAQRPRADPGRTTRLGAIQGIVLDADGSTLLVNWYSEWAISQAAEIDFALDTGSTDVRGKCAQVKRQMMIAAKGAWLPGTHDLRALPATTSSTR